MKDEDIDKYIKSKKNLIPNSIKWKIQRKSKQCEITLHSSGLNLNFVLYLRQNLIDPEHFSCGLKVLKNNNENITLLRFNGCNHVHTNQLEKDKLEFKYHIHKATEKYIQASLKADGYAYETNRYNDLQSAIECLLADANVSGLQIVDLQQQGGFDFD